MMTTTVTRFEEDLALLRRIAEADDRALEELYDRYGQMIYNLVVKMLRSVEESERIVEEVFLQVWTKASSYENTKSTVYTWLVTMARNRAVDRMRSKSYKRQPSGVDITSLLLEADARSSASDQDVVAEYQRLVVGAMNQLHYEQQEILAIAFFEGISKELIAERLGISSELVQARLCDSLMRMRDWIDGRIP